jgi:hypothetical protein
MCLGSGTPSGFAHLDRGRAFMEFPPLVAGQTALSAVHLTRLSDFSAMTTGHPQIEFKPDSGGAATTLPGNEPSRPGVFGLVGPVRHVEGGELRFRLGRRRLSTATA